MRTLLVSGVCAFAMTTAAAAMANEPAGTVAVDEERTITAQATDTTAPDATAPETMPTDAMPTDAMPTDAMPADAMPADTTASDSMPTDAMPTDTVAAPAVDTEALLGIEVIDSAGDEVGEVNDIIMTDGLPEVVVIEAGGWMGIAERLVAVPFAETSMSDDQEVMIVTTMTMDQIEELPTFEPAAEEMEPAPPAQ